MSGEKDGFGSLRGLWKGWLGEQDSSGLSVGREWV